MNHVDSNPAPPAAPPSGHRTSVSEGGSFSTASCGCGWFAPARRSRDKSRRDADRHLAEQLHPDDS